MQLNYFHSWGMSSKLKVFPGSFVFFHYFPFVFRLSLSNVFPDCFLIKHFSTKLLYTAVLLFLNVRVNSYPKDVLVHLHLSNFSPVHLFGTGSIRFSCSFFTFFLLFFCCCHLYFNWLPSSHQFKSKSCFVQLQEVFPSKAVIADVVKYLAEQSDICQMLAVGCRTHTNILPLHDWVSNTHQISFKYQKTSTLFNNSALNVLAIYVLGFPLLASLPAFGKERHALTLMTPDPQNHMEPPFHVQMIHSW